MSNTDNPDALKSLKQIKNQLALCERKKAESAIFRSKAEYIRSGEKNTKYFFGLEKRRYFTKNSECIINDKGEIIYDNKEILHEQVKFYKDLYCEDKEIKFTLRPGPTETVLSETDKNKLEEDISEGEIFDAMMTLKSGKVPGLDGLTIEFYRHFYKDLKSPLMNMYQLAYHNNELPRTARRGLISLLPKRNRDSRYIKHKRPLTLIGYDYKILAKLMDNRLRSVLDKLIHADQTGFLKNRHISTNIRKTLDVIEYCTATNQPGLIMSIDMMKCFDRVSYKAISGAFQYFNFGPIFTRWSSLFFKNFEVCTQNNGFLSNFFVKGRSINQGCPYSPSVYLLISEIMANKLRNNHLITGISIGKIKLLLSLFADDMDLYLPYEQTVLNEVISELSRMEANLGLKVSYDKTTLYRIGSIAGSNAKLYTSRPIKWSSGHINTLGVDIYAQRVDLTTNYQAIIEKMRTISKIWYYRSMTLIGKILVVNTLMASLFVYRMQTLPKLEDKQCKEIDEVIKSFLWRGRKSKFNLETLRRPKNKGGLGLVDFQAKHTSLLLNWIPRINHNPVLYELSSYFIGDSVKNGKIWCSNLNCQDMKQICKTKNGFWYDLTQTWAKVNYHEPQSCETVENQKIILNSHLKIGGKVIDNDALEKNNIILIKDLVRNGKILKYDELPSKEGITWLDYSALVASIPELWRFALKSELLIDDSVPKYLKWKIFEATSISRTVYHNLTDSESALISSGKIWRNKLNNNFDLERHMCAFKNIYAVTNIVKLRNFQYRLLHNKIFCNDILFHFKCSSSQKCDFCDHPKQDVIHLLYSCEKTTELWSRVKLFIDQHTNDSSILEWNLSNIIYNLVHPKSTHVVNFLILLCKFTIFRGKCNYEFVSFDSFLYEVIYMYNIEYYNSIKNNRLNHHMKKWNNIHLPFLLNFY